MLRILGHDYDVLYRDDLNAFGKASIRAARLYIDPALGDEQQLSTILHEVLELIMMQMELNMDHQAVCSVETGMYQFLVENGVDLSPLLEGIDGISS